MANGQTIVQYGSLVIYRAQIQKFDQQPVMDPTGIDLTRYKYTVTVSGYIHGMPTSGSCIRHSISDGTATIRDKSATDSMIQIRWRLPPRQTFTLALGCESVIGDGKRILYAQPIPSGITTPSDLATERGITGNSIKGLTFFDVNDGPKCLDFSIDSVAADNIFKVTATFEIHRVQCDDNDKSNSTLSGVLSNKWSCSDHLDVNLRATRVYRGMLEIATATFSPHWFRYLVVPPINNGFRRDQMSFVASEDGRKLQWSITDQEIAISCPHPAKKWSVQHTETTLAQDGIKGHASISVSLEGDSNVDKTQLIFLGLNIITAKLVGAPVGVAPLHFVTFGDLTITDFTGDVNAVHLSATCSTLLSGIDNVYIPRQDGFRKIIEDADLPAYARNYDPRTSEGGRIGQTPEYKGPATLIGIFRCYLQDPCTDAHGINIGTNQLGTDENGNPAGTPAASFSAVTVSDMGDGVPDYYSTSQTQYPYTHYQCESQYVTKSMRAAMPIATSVYTGSLTDVSWGTRMVSMSRSQTRLIIRVVAERTGQWPETPDAELVGYVYAGGGPKPTGYPAITPWAQVATNNYLGSSGLPDVQMSHMSTKRLGGTRVKTAEQGVDRFRTRFEMKFALSRTPYPTEVLKFGHDKYSTDQSGNGTVSNTVLTNSNWS